MYGNRKGKPVRGYKQYLAELKTGKVSPVLFLEGEEEYLVKWAVEQMKKRFVRPGMEAMDFATFSGDEVVPEQLIESLDTLPMLSEKRVVWVREIAPLHAAGTSRGWTNDLIGKLAEYVEKPNDRTIAIFSIESGEPKSSLVKALKKHGDCFTFGRLTQKELESFANKRFRAADKKIEVSAMRELMACTGYFNKDGDYRLYQFESDVQKIIAHTQGPVIQLKDIEDTVSGEGNRFIFDLLDGVSGNDKTKAFALIHNVLADSGKDEMYLVRMIAGQMELLLEVREFLDGPNGRMTPAQMAKHTGMNEYRLRKASDYARKYSVEKLRSMVLGIYEVNTRIVTGLMSPRLALEMFVASI